MYSKYITVDDFRGKTISPIISRVLEHCIMERCEKFFTSSDNQFGFKKKSSCSHATYSLRNVVDSYVKNGSTVNICALDLTKAFGLMNHHGLFTRLTQRHLPLNVFVCFRELVLYLLHMCKIRQHIFLFFFFKLSCGIRQGGVLSPFLFAFTLTVWLIKLVIVYLVASLEMCA